MPLQMPEAHRERAVAHWAVVSVSALYGANAAAYAGKTRLRMYP